MWPEFNEPISVPYAHVLREIEVEIKTGYMLVLKVREIGKDFTIYKNTVK